LLAAGELYESYSSPEEVEARRKAAGQDPKLGYDNFDRDLTDEQQAEFRAQGREAVLRLRMPDEDITFTDYVRGEVTFKVGTVPDPVLVRANGSPLYTLTNPVDDALMRITHILRGEDLLPSTPRQIALFQALQRIGVAETVPQYAHLPLVRGEGNKKLSKRDPESNLFLYRDRGFLPEGLLNYLALLGWAIADDRDVFSMSEMVQAFDITKVSSNPARFDMKKAEAINAVHLRALAPDDFVERTLPYLAAAGLVAEKPTDEQRELFGGIAPLIQERIVVLSDAVEMTRFLFVSEDDFVLDADAAAKNLGEAGRLNGGGLQLRTLRLGGDRGSGPTTRQSLVVVTAVPEREAGADKKQRTHEFVARDLEAKFMRGEEIVVVLELLVERPQGNTEVLNHVMQAEFVRRRHSPPQIATLIVEPLVRSGRTRTNGYVREEARPPTTRRVESVVRRDAGCLIPAQN
ncbi:glutamate--tRNA ligase, partial [Kibdelosporangium lantanae]